MRNLSLGALVVLCLWVLESWVAYFWGLATGHKRVSRVATLTGFSHISKLVLEKAYRVALHTPKY